jgi:HlyD family secretion protein
MNFRTSGQLTEIDVKVGDQVKDGQVLAKLDSTTQRSSLASAQAALLSAQAALQAAQSPLTSAQIEQLQHAVTGAETSYNDTVNSVNATNNADAQQVQTDQNQLSHDQGLYNANSCGDSSPPPACQGPQGYIAAVNSDSTKLAQDQSKQPLDQISGQRRIDQGLQQITTAQDNLTVQSQVKPNSVAQAQAQVASSQAQVQSAQMALDQTVLSAPVDGTVNSINGVVGETAGGSGSTTSQSPGSSGPAPSGSSSGSGSSGSASGASSGSGSSGSATIVLASTSGYQAVVPFAESDAAKLSSNQDVNLTFDAVPNLIISGKVLTLAPTATVVSNVVNYYATIVLNSNDPRLRAGMTTNASVTIKEVHDVLTVPNAAIQSNSGTQTVNLMRSGQQVSTQVEPGLIGDSTTEVKAGLSDGDQVALPTSRSTPATQPGGGNRGFFGPGPGGIGR